jgi:uncharacterized membrane-anchored protein
MFLNSPDSQVTRGWLAVKSAERGPHCAANTSAFIERGYTVIRRVLAVLILIICCAPAQAEQDETTQGAIALDSPGDVYARALSLSIGAPLRADLGTAARVRLSADLVFTPHEQAQELLQAYRRAIPSDFIGLLTIGQGMTLTGTVRFVPAGFIDANAILPWRADDILDSLRDTIEQDNALRLKRGALEREARRWIHPPTYNPELHLLTWAVLVVPKVAPRNSNGEVVFNGIAFGRDGYIQVAIPTSVEDAPEAERMVDLFLQGVSFQPGRTYQDFQVGDPIAPGGLAAAMGIDMLHKEQSHVSFWASDALIPVVGLVVATIGGIALLIQLSRYQRRRSRRF